MTSEPTIIDTPLSKQQRDMLVECIRTVDDGQAAFLAVGRALATIRDGRLHRESHKTFEGFVRDRWDFGRSHAYRLIDAAVKVDVSPNGGQTAPTSERQVRPLLQLPTDDRTAAWQEAVESAGGGDPPTAQQVQAVVDRRLGKKPEPPPPQDVPVDGFGDPVMDEKLAEIFEVVPSLQALVKQITTIRREVKVLAGIPGGACLTAQQIDLDLKNAGKAISFAVPYCACPPKVTKGPAKKRGWLTKEQYDRLPDDQKWSE